MALNGAQRLDLERAPVLIQSDGHVAAQNNGPQGCGPPIQRVGFQAQIFTPKVTPK